MAFPSARLLERITAAAPAWDLGLAAPVTARVEHSTERPQSATAVVALASGDGAARVFVKAPFVSEPRLADRPRLGLDRDFHRKHEFEWQALTHMWDSGRSSTRGIGAVRPLLHDAQERVLVLEHVRAPSLRELLDSGDRARCIEVAGAAGRWLATFQQLEGLRGLEPKRTTSRELVETVESFSTFLRDPLAKRLADGARARLAEIDIDVDNDLGVGHADFAPRNVLTRGEDVCAIDPLGRWRIPVLEDVAYFVLELELGGKPRLRRLDVAPLRAAFLSGHGTADDERLTAMEALVLLDKWAAIVTTRVTSPTAQARQALRRRRVQHMADRLVARLGGQRRA